MDDYHYRDFFSFGSFLTLLSYHSIVWGIRPQEMCGRKYGTQEIKRIMMRMTIYDGVSTNLECRRVHVSAGEGRRVVGMACRAE